MTGLSIWEKESFYAPQDITIVGAGLMGLWTALELKKRNSRLRITIIERSSTPLGASTRNAGFACFGSPTQLLQDITDIGEDTTLEIAEMRYKGIAKIRQHFADEEIDFDPCGGYECINQHYPHWNVLDEKTSLLNRLLKEITGNPTLFTRADDKLKSLGLEHFDCLIENRSEAALHSGKLMQALTQRVYAADVAIRYGTELTHWIQQGDLVTLYTNNPAPLKTRQLLFCTNAFTGALLPQLNIEPARGQVILTSPIPGLAMRGTFHFDEGFYYWRNLGNRILLGGARNIDFDAERTTSLYGSATIRQALESFLQQHLSPSYTYTIDHHWSGIMAFTENRKPFTGEVTRQVFAAIACNGMGVALIPIVAEKAAAMLLRHF